MNVGGEDEHTVSVQFNRTKRADGNAPSQQWSADTSVPDMDPNGSTPVQMIIIKAMRGSDGHIKR